MIGPKRDWHDAIEKVETEGKCRNCSQLAEDVKIDAAHTAGRKYDQFRICKVCNGSGWRTGGRVQCGTCHGRGTLKTRWVDPMGIVPLCADCHRAQHSGEVELLPLLTAEEQAFVVETLGGIMAAFTHLTIRSAGMIEERAA